MHLDTITELLNIPNHKVAGVIKSDPERSYMILERIHRQFVPDVVMFTGHPIIFSSREKKRSKKNNNIS